MSEELLFEKEGRIATITLNRPEQRNALTTNMWVRIAEVMNSLQDDDEVRAVVIRGAGDKAFASGADIAELHHQTSRESHTRQTEILEAALNSIINYRFPVIAMINGFCMGAGCQLATVCDLRIASEKSKFAIPAAKVGVVFNYPMTRRIVSVVGPAAAREILFLGEAFDAQRALQMGLVNRVVPEESLREAVYGIARTIAENAPLSVMGAKKMIARCTAYEDGIEHSDLDEMELQSFESEDAAEGIRSFLEKRRPRFVGR